MGWLSEQITRFLRSKGDFVEITVMEVIVACIVVVVS